MLRRFVPLIDQMKGYGRRDLQGDLSAGLTVGIMLIPQGMAYALIAGVPPIYGLYASLVPLVVFALFGTSRHLSVAPVAMVSLLTASGVAPLAGGDIERYIALALGLALFVGLIQFGLGIARFGFLTNFLSHPILAGFTSAAALIIGFSQLKHLLGVDIGSSHYIHKVLWSAARQLGHVHIPTLVIGLASIGALVALRKWKRALPGALVIVVLSILAVWMLALHGVGVEIVGDIPSGLPLPGVPVLSLADFRDLLPSALAISLVGFMESIAVAKVYASRHRYEVDANQELVGLGLANVAGSFFQAFPTTGGFSRTAVNVQAGARTQLAGIVSAGIIGLTLLFLTPLFFYLPKAVLAAIVMVAVAGLFDWKEARYLWAVDRRDFTLMLLTFAATLALGIEQGILAGVVASLVVVLHQSSRPHAAIEGRLPDTTTYRNVARNAEALLHDGIVVFRMDASLYFANVAFFRDTVRDIVDTREPNAIVLNAFPINRIDSSATHALRNLIEDVRRRDVELFVAGLKGPVRDVLEKAGLVDLIGQDHFFHEVHQAVQAASKSATLRNSDPVPTFT